MDGRLEQRETSSSLCAMGFFDCFSSKPEHGVNRFSVLAGVKRETTVIESQPHLVEPMKLRVYEDLPATPTLPPPSHLALWGRDLASRASSRTSRISLKRRTRSKSMFVKLRPAAESSTDLPLRRRAQFSPLQLSFYLESNRLSDLPAFDRLSFTDIGELKAPPRALVRTQSETMLRSCEKTTGPPPKRTASMYEPGDISFARPETSHSIVSISRPPSGYDALHSHPVSWASLPGIPATKSQKPDNVVAVMTPMKEEFSPVDSPVTVDGTSLAFPKTVGLEQIAASTTTLPEAQAPYPVVYSGPASAPLRSSKESAGSYFTTNQRAQKRISQWLQYRSHSNSTSTIGSVSTSASFAEHRRKRSEFYKLGQQPNVPALVPQPLNFSFTKTIATRQHQRTDTESTMDTVSTSVLSSNFDKDSRHNSLDSMTTADIKSRTGTVKSVTSPAGLKLVAKPDQRPGLAVTTPCSAEIVNQRGLYVKEINGPLRSPGVGIAF